MPSRSRLVSRDGETMRVGSFVCLMVAFAGGFFRAADDHASGVCPSFFGYFGARSHSNFQSVACEVLTRTLRVTMASNPEAFGTVLQGLQG